MKQQIERDAMALMMGTDIPTPPPPKPKKKFPDYFFAVHREKFANLASQYPPGRVLTMICRESYANYTDPNSGLWTVEVKIVQSERGVHIVPFSDTDIRTAEEWELRNMGVPENEFAN